MVLFLFLHQKILMHASFYKYIFYHKRNMEKTNVLRSINIFPFVMYHQVITCLCNREAIKHHSFDNVWWLKIEKILAKFVYS